MPRSVPYVSTVVHHYEHEYNELKGGEQILSVRFANICIQIFRANNEQPSRVSSKLCRFEVASSTAASPVSVQRDSRSLDSLL